LPASHEWTKLSPFIIAKAGRPMIQITKPEAQPELPRSGFLRGKIHIPDDFDTYMQREIIAMFEGEDRDENGKE